MLAAGARLARGYVGPSLRTPHPVGGDRAGSRAQRHDRLCGGAHWPSCVQEEVTHVCYENQWWRVAPRGWTDTLAVHGRPPWSDEAGLARAEKVQSRNVWRGHEDSEEGGVEDGVSEGAEGGKKQGVRS